MSQLPHLCITATVLHNALHFLMHELDTAQRWLFKTTYLSLNEQLERHFGHEQGATRALYWWKCLLRL